jgi:biotin carboxyl carrier protein
VDGGIGMGLVSAAVPQVQEFVVRVGEREHTVRVEDGVAHVDGVALAVLPAASGSVVREAGGAQRRVVLAEPAPGKSFAGSASVAGIAAEVEVQTAQAAALAAALAAGGGGGRAGSQVKAPMPGRVVKLLVEVDQAVERGAPLAIVEAMKMENELHAPAAGKVLRVHVAPGQAVESGQLLIELELA